MVQGEISFKDSSYIKFWWPLCSAEHNHLCKFGRGHHEEFCAIILNLDQWFRCCFLSKALGAFCSAERNQLCNFGRGHHEEPLCEIILNLDQCFILKISYLSSGGPHFRQYGTIYAILVEGIMGNILMKLIWTSGSGVVV